MSDNFTPGETVALNATSTASSVSFTLPQSANFPDCLVTNTGQALVFVGFGGPAQNAGINATPVPPNAQSVIRKGAGVTLCSAVTIAGNVQLYFTAGEGS